MTELQSSILDIFKEFQRVCTENNLRYYAIGGTCLGAIRHNGFIPWDDDLDVAMPLEDYQIFRNLWPQLLKEPYQVLDHEKVQHCSFSYLKLFNGDTTFIEQAVEAMPDRYTGIFMDIMPIAGWPNEKKTQKLLQSKIVWYGRLNLYTRFNAEQLTTLKSKAVQALSRPIWSGKLFNHYSLKIENETAQNAFGTTQYVLFPWRAKGRNVFSYEIFRESVSVPFEDTEICVPRGYDQYLTMDFGDYMKLPPEDKRHGEHTAAIIDFHKSFREYQEAKK